MTVDLLLSRKRELLLAFRSVGEEELSTAIEAAERIEAAMRAGGKLLIFGNGGSAADSQHMAAELVSSLDRTSTSPALPAIALTTDTSLLTAYSNDFDVQGIFSRQVSALARVEDVALGISTSGKSPNVVAGIQRANELGLITIAMTGSEGLKGVYADIELRAPASDTQTIQTVHQFYYHCVCESLLRQWALTH